MQQRLLAWWAAPPHLRSKMLGRWLVSLGQSQHYTTFYLRVPPNRCIGIIEQPIAINSIDGTVYRLEWYGNPTDDEKMEILLLT